MQSRPGNISGNIWGSFRNVYILTLVLGQKMQYNDLHKILQEDTPWRSTTMN